MGSGCSWLAGTTSFSLLPIGARIPDSEDVRGVSESRKSRAL